MLNGFFHYTFLDGRLIGSEHPTARGSAQQRVSEMISGGGTAAMLTLAGGFHQYHLSDLIQYHLPMPEIPTRDQVAHAVGVVRKHLYSGDRVWVHCKQGLDRTGAVIGGYLCQSGLEPDQVIAMLLKRFPSRRRHPAMLELWQPFEQLIRSFAQPT